MALAGVALLSAPAAARKPERRPGTGTANPSALVAAEIAFARMAREKGQWTAFREFADENAVLFVPEAVRAADWLKGRSDPPATVQWQPYQVWMSCDGTAGATRGAWQRPDGSVGYFTTIWRQRKNKDEFRWVLDQGDTLAQPLKEPYMLSASVADCPTRGFGPPQGESGKAEPQSSGGAVGTQGAGQSQDGTLTWNWQVNADKSRSLVVMLRKGDGMAEAMRSDVAAPQGQ